MDSFEERQTNNVEDGTTVLGESGTMAVGDGMIGPYRVVEILGTGGFGTVYRAEQREPVKREVALKVIRRGMDSEAVSRRFAAERQALALMDHPGIAAVLDAGTTEKGQAYFVMSLVRGESITSYCDRRDLGFADRIGIFRDVCHALQHAHHKGVIHRDVKPSNILVAEVDGKPHVKVIDFGVAKALGAQLGDAAAFTMEQQVIGTPQYMSPEQISGGRGVDTRSDVYSLGVVLYELLVGTAVIPTESLKGVGVEEMIRLVKDEPTPRPSTRVLTMVDVVRTKCARRRGLESPQFAKQLKGDLDWIVMKALEKEQARRYQSPGALADDLERYLSGQVVEARSPSVGYRMAKFAKRHRVGLVAAGFVAMALVTGGVVAVWQAVRATRASALANERLVLAEDARDAAEELLGSAVFELRDKLWPMGEVAVLEDIVKGAEDYYAKLPGGLLSARSERYRAGIGLIRAIIARAQGKREDAMSHIMEALALAERMCRENPDDEVSAQTLCEALLVKEENYYSDRNAVATKDVADEVTRLTDTWMAKLPEETWPLRSRFAAISLAAAVYLRTGDRIRAAFMGAEANNWHHRWKELDPGDPEVNAAGAMLDYWMATFARTGGKNMDVEKASAVYRKAFDSLNAVLASGNRHLLILEVHSAIGREGGGLILETGLKRKDAVLREEGSAMLDAGVRTAERLVKLEPGRGEWWFDLSAGYGEQHRFAAKEGRFAEARSLLEMSILRLDRALKAPDRQPKFVASRAHRCLDTVRLELADTASGSPDAASVALREAWAYLTPDSAVGKDLMGFAWGSWEGTRGCVRSLAGEDRWNDAIELLDDWAARLEVFSKDDSAWSKEMFPIISESLDEMDRLLAESGEEPTEWRKRKDTFLIQSMAVETNDKGFIGWRSTKMVQRAEEAVRSDVATPENLAWQTLAIEAALREGPGYGKALAYHSAGQYQGEVVGDPKAALGLYRESTAVRALMVDTAPGDIGAVTGYIRSLLSLCSREGESAEGRDKVSLLQEGIDRVIPPGKDTEQPYGVDNLPRLFRSLAEAEWARGNTEASLAAEERAAQRLKRHWVAYVADETDVVPHNSAPWADVGGDFRRYGDRERADLWMEEGNALLGKAAEADAVAGFAKETVHREYLRMLRTRVAWLAEEPDVAGAGDGTVRMGKLGLAHIERWEKAVSAVPEEILGWKAGFDEAARGGF